MKRFFLLLSLAIVFFSGGSIGQTDITPIKIGVHVSPPYVIRQDDNIYSGIAVDLIRRVFMDADIHRPVLFYEYPSVKELLHAIDDIDIAVSNLSYTPERARDYELSVPYDEGGLGILIASDTQGKFAGSFPLITYLYIGLGIFLASFGLTIIDRKYTPGFTRSWIVGFSESLYHVVSLLLKGGSKRQSFFSKPVQYWLSVIWMFCGSALISFLMVSYMGLLTPKEKISSINDLSGSTVAVQEGSSAENYVRQMNFEYITFKIIDDGISMMKNGSITAIIGDRSVLKHYAHTSKGLKLHVVDNIFINSELYGYLFPYGSDLRRKVTEGVIFHINNGTVQSIKKHYGTD